MTKNQILVVVLSSLVLSACSLPFFQSTPNPAGGEALMAGPSPTVVQVKTKTWDDPAGFRFSYPENLTLNSHPEDNQNYANLEIGPVRVLMSDNKYKSLSDWAKPNTAIQTVLGDKEALKIKSDQKLTLAATDNDVLVVIESPISEEKLFDQIVASFEFVYPAPAASGGESSEDVLEEIGE